MSGHTVGGDYRETEKHNAGINATMTTLSHYGRDYWKSPWGTVIRIEVLVGVTSILLLLLAIFGSCRRRSRSKVIQNVVLGALALSSSLVTYTLGSMQSSAVKSCMYPIWAISLFILFSCAGSITACSLDDNNQTSRRLYQYILGYTYVLLISATISSGIGYITVGVLAVMAWLKLTHRVTASRLASGSLNLNKMVADYMYQEHTETNGGIRYYDPASMQGYRYLVDWPLGMSKLDAGTSYAAELTAEFINIEKVWLSKDGSLSQELKDACLSFSLFHLLRRRFFGFACAESTLQKTRDFVFMGLLLFKKDEDDGTATNKCDYDRVFKVIEVELAFMYDFFFTKHAVLYYGSSVAAIWSLASASCLISLAVYLIASRAVRDYAILDRSEAVVINKNTTTDVVITLLILTSGALIELLQLLFYWANIWGRVSFVCQHIRLRPTEPSNSSSSRGGSWCNRMMRFRECLAKISVCCASNKHYWQNKLEQYSLLEPVSCNCKPPNQTSMYWNFMILASRLLYLLDIVMLHPRNDKARWARRKLGKPIGLSEDVKGALVESLKRTESKNKLTNGKSSLVSNEVDPDLISWACEQGMDSCADPSCSQKNENLARLILTWHIATCYCEMIASKYPRPNEGTDPKLHIDVATTLSKYCAYLVVCEPRLLPRHHYDTTRVFDAVAEEAVHFLEGERDKYLAMKNKHLTEPTTTKTIFWRGVKLGRQLERMEEGRRWKVLAEFWVELMLYVAPSDNVKDHIECLARGGELVTHLWALLSHAGILKREEHHVEDMLIIEHIRSV